MQSSITYRTVLQIFCPNWMHPGADGFMNVLFSSDGKKWILSLTHIKLTQLCLSPVALVNSHIAVDTQIKFDPFCDVNSRGGATLMQAKWIKLDLVDTHVIQQEGCLCCAICYHDEYFTFTDTDGDTLLHRVCSAGNEKLARVLLKHRANPNSLNNLQQSPILLAAKTGQVCSVTNKQL